MKKFHKLTSLLLVLVMSLALAVPAFAAGGARSFYESIHKPYDNGAYQFDTWSDLSSNGFEWRASAYSNATGNLPSSNYVEIVALLCNSSGRTLQTDRTTGGSSRLVFKSTSGYAGSDAYGAKGYAYYGGVAHTIPGVDKYGGAFTRARVMAAGLGSVNGYSVNSHGRTYGSTMLADVVGYEPDLISAVGVDGVEGYILYEDVCPATYRAGEIPLYDQEGIVIGTFMNGTGDSLAVGK